MSDRCCTAPFSPNFTLYAPYILCPLYASCTTYPPTLRRTHPIQLTYLAHSIVCIQLNHTVHLTHSSILLTMCTLRHFAYPIYLTLCILHLATHPRHFTSSVCLTYTLLIYTSFTSYTPHTPHTHPIHTPYTLHATPTLCQMTSNGKVPATSTCRMDVGQRR